MQHRQGDREATLQPSCVAGLTAAISSHSSMAIVRLPARQMQEMTGHPHRGYGSDSSESGRMEDDRRPGADREGLPDT